MSESLAQVAGIDISKDHLDVHLASQRRHPAGDERQGRAQGVAALVQQTEGGEDRV